MMKRTALILTIASICSVWCAQGLSQESVEKTIPETAIAAGNFKTLVAAAKAAGLVETLAGDGPFTVLAPTDAAFAKLPAGTVKSLLKPENKDKLIAILKMHVAADRLTSDMAQPGAEFPTLSGTPLKVDVKGKTISVGSAKVVKADIACSNGVIHAIDSVLLPSVPVDAKMLVGKWSYASAVKNGEKKTAKDLAGQSVDITSKSWTLNSNGSEFVMDYKIDTKAEPRKITFTITKSPFGTGMSSGGVIKMVGDQLVVCYAPQGGTVPTKFAAAADSNFHLFYLKKEQDESKSTK